jgi:hypothetical protein
VSRNLYLLIFTSTAIYHSTTLFTTMYNSNGGENTIHIYHLPNEILSKICLFTTLPNSLTRNQLVGVIAGNVLADAQQYRQLIAKELQMARILRLVSWRFTHLATPLLFHSLLLVQNKIRMPFRECISEQDLQTGYEGELARELGTIMEILHNLLSLKPDLSQHCKSLCFVYKEQYLGDSYSSGMSDEGHSEDGTEVSNGEIPEMDINFPRAEILNDIHTWLVNVTDFQVYVDGFAKEMPNFSIALISMPKLTILRITGDVDYLSIFKQLATIQPDSILKTLDLSNTTSNGWEYNEPNARAACQTLHVSHNLYFIN